MPFGLESTGIPTDGFLYIIIGVCVFLWVYCILRVAKDISYRTSHFGLQLLSIILIVVCTPILGLPIYFLIRPVRYELDNYNLQQALLAEMIICLECDRGNNPTYTFCAYCGSKLKQQCSHCKKAYAVNYEFCPFCGDPNLALDA